MLVPRGEEGVCERPRSFLTPKLCIRCLLLRSLVLRSNLGNAICTRTIERDMPGSGAAIVRNMTTYFPDPICRFHQSQGLVVAEVRYEELIVGRMGDHLMRVR